jgi:hypothetical protein
LSTSLQRGLAQALLPAAILPVLLFGPGIVRAPQTLWRRGTADVRRLLAPAPSGHRRARAAASGGRRAVTAGVRNDAHLFPGARYAPLRARSGVPGGHATATVTQAGTAGR